MREKWQDIEGKILSEFACLSKNSKGRVKFEAEDDIRTCFQRDRDRILHSKSFRRLKHKTQVFITPEGDHYRTRLTHTLEVSQIARTIARALSLNEDLTEAIAMGHDLGHTPFGHAGEKVLSEIHPAGFYHNEHSLRVVDVLENGCGLNLCWEVRDGIKNHTGPNLPATLEGQVVRYADRIAYINHDIDDAIRGQIIFETDIPVELSKILGSGHGQRISTMVRDIIENSQGQNLIKMSDEIDAALKELRQFMFKNVYVASAAKAEEDKAMKIVKEVYDYYMNHPDELPSGALLDKDLANNVRDFVAGMSDKYIISIYKKIVLPEPWLII